MNATLFCFCCILPKRFQHLCGLIMQSESIHSWRENTSFNKGKLFQSSFFFIKHAESSSLTSNKSIVLFPLSILSSVWIRSLLVRSYFSIWSLHGRLSALCLAGNLSHTMASGIGEPVLPVIRCLLSCYPAALVWGKVELRGRSVEAALSASLFGTLRTSERSCSSVDNCLKPFPSNGQKVQLLVAITLRKTERIQREQAMKMWPWMRTEEKKCKCNDVVLYFRRC